VAVKTEQDVKTVARVLQQAKDNPAEFDREVARPALARAKAGFCICMLVGKDGTTQHTEFAGRVFQDLLYPDNLAHPCSNHVHHYEGAKHIFKRVEEA